MTHLFNDTNSAIVLFIGIFVSAIFLIGVCEFTKQSVVGVEGTLTEKMKKKGPTETNIK